MSIRKRSWTTKAGEKRSSWVVDYTDQHGKRHIKTFDKKDEARDFADGTRIEVKSGVHVADADTVTIAEAAVYWLETCEEQGLERSTRAQYDQHCRLHIVPEIGNRRLNEVTVPFVRSFMDTMRKKGRSAAMQRAVRVSFGALISDAQERGLIVQNAVKELSRTRTKKKSNEARHVEPVQVGVDLPSPDEIRKIMPKTTGKVRVFYMTAIFTGMRASELRGLRWSDIDLAKAEVTIRQRADTYQEIGSPKSKSGRRVIPLVRDLVAALKEWKTDCPKGEANLVFPNSAGNVEWHANIVKRWYHPAQIESGVTVKEINDKGESVAIAKYSGLHALRHFYASWCINRPEDGGLGLAAKIVQERMGHSSIQVTLDTYSHLFERAGAGDAMDAAASALLG